MLTHTYEKSIVSGSYKKKVISQLMKLVFVFFVGTVICFLFWLFTFSLHGKRMHFTDVRSSTIQ
jgi:hypothetical protein